MYYNSVHINGVVINKISLYLCNKSWNNLLQVWNSDYPVSIKYRHDMKIFSWKYTQFSQFNSSDTLLLVSGVRFGTPLSTSGEIAVFKLTGEKIVK